MTKKKSESAPEEEPAEGAEKDEAKSAAAAQLEKVPWYHPEDWTRATVDCTAYGWGTFTVHEPQMSELKKADNVVGSETKLKGDDAARSQAATFRAFVKEHAFVASEDSGARVTAQLPKLNASWESWLEWHGKFPQKVCARLAAGVALFNQDYGLELGGN